MNPKLYTKLQESLEDVFQPPTEEELDIRTTGPFIREIENQGAYKNPDGTWSSEGDISIPDGQEDDRFVITKIPVQFKEVKGNFYCGFGRLTTLKGCPEVVGGDFMCGHTRSLTSLEGSPKIVGKAFDCGSCWLTSLEGGPEKVGGEYNCRDNQLDSLKGAPKEVGGSFNCSRNRLRTLKDAPKKIGGIIQCVGNLRPENELRATIGK